VLKTIPTSGVVNGTFGNFLFFFHVRIMRVVKSFWGFISLIQILDIVCAIVPCKNLDFSQLDDPRSLQQCSYKQQFHHKSYTNSNNRNKSLKPLNLKSKFYLTNQNEGESCAEFNTIFKLNKTSAISLTYNMIYTEGAKLIIRIIDMDKSKKVKDWPQYQNSNGWKTLTITNVPNIDRAKVHNNFSS
jgi:hypothetical protein